MPWWLLALLGGGAYAGVEGLKGWRKGKAEKRLTARQAMERSRALATLVATERGRARQKQFAGALTPDMARLTEMTTIGFPQMTAERMKGAGLEQLLSGLANAETGDVEAGLQAAAGREMSLEALRRAASPPARISPVLSALGLL